MIGYTLVGTNDLDRAKAFYDALFGTLEVARTMEMDGRMCAWGEDMAKPMFGVCVPYDGKPATVGNGTMLALPAGSRDRVAALHAKAMELGSADEGEPGLRGPEGDQAFYMAYFRDLDGNKLAVFHVGAA